MVSLYRSSCSLSHMPAKCLEQHSQLHGHTLRLVPMRPYGVDVEKDCEKVICYLPAAPVVRGEPLLGSNNPCLSCYSAFSQLNLER